MLLNKGEKEGLRTPDENLQGSAFPIIDTFIDASGVIHHSQSQLLPLVGQIHLVFYPACLIIAPFTYQGDIFSFLLYGDELCKTNGTRGRCPTGKASPVPPGFQGPNKLANQYFSKTYGHLCSSGNWHSFGKSIMA